MDGIRPVAAQYTGLRRIRAGFVISGVPVCAMLVWAMLAWAMPACAMLAWAMLACAILARCPGAGDWLAVLQEMGCMICIARKVVDGAAFESDRTWDWQGRRGKLVQILGLQAAAMNEDSGREAAQRLLALIGGKHVEITPRSLRSQRLVAEVYIDGKDVAALLGRA